MGFLREGKGETIGEVGAHVLGGPRWDKSLHAAAPQLP